MGCQCRPLAIHYNSTPRKHVFHRYRRCTLRQVPFRQNSKHRKVVLIHLPKCYWIRIGSTIPKAQVPLSLLHHEQLDPPIAQTRCAFERVSFSWNNSLQLRHHLQLHHSRLLLARHHPLITVTRSTDPNFFVAAKSKTATRLMFTLATF